MPHSADHCLRMRGAGRRARDRSAVCGCTHPAVPAPVVYPPRHPLGVGSQWWIPINSLMPPALRSGSPLGKSHPTLSRYFPSRSMSTPMNLPVGR